MTVALSTMLLAGSMVMSVSADENPQYTNVAPEKVNVVVQKLQYKEGKNPQIQNTGQTIDIGTVDGVEKYDKSKYGDVEFAILKLDAQKLKEEGAGKDAQTIAQEVEDSMALYAPGTDESLAFGAKYVLQNGHPSVEVDDTGKVTFTEIVNNQENVYVIVETKSPATVVTKAAPMLIQLPITAPNKKQFLAGDVILYPKNKVEELSGDFFKTSRPNGVPYVEPEDVTLPEIDEENITISAMPERGVLLPNINWETFNNVASVGAPMLRREGSVANVRPNSVLFQGAKFHIYKGEVGQGVLIQGDNGPVVYETNAQGTFKINGLTVGKYYLVEIESENKVDGMITEVTNGLARTDVGTHLVGGDALNDANNKLVLLVDGRGNVKASSALMGYENFERPEITLEIKSTYEGAKPNFDKFEDINYETVFTVPENFKDYSTAKLVFKSLKGTEMSLNEFAIQGDSFVLTTKEGTPLEVDVDYRINKDGLYQSTIDLIPTEKTYKTDQIIIKFKGDILEDAVHNGDYKVEVALTYNNSKFGNTKDRFDKKSVDFTTYSFEVKKTDDGLFGTNLAPDGLVGVKFKLKNNDGNFFLGFEQGNGHEIWGDETNAKVLESGENGKVQIIGLGEGQYTLVEIETLEDYNLPTAGRENTAITVNNASNTNIVTIVNTRKPGLPMTGAEQVTLVVGGITGLIVLAGGLVLIDRKKKKAKLNA